MLLLQIAFNPTPCAQYFLKLVMVNHEIIVNFNIYFRMTAGKSEVRATFYVSEETTIAQLESEVFITRLNTRLIAAAIFRSRPT